MASKSQAFTHFWHAVQQTEQTRRALEPLSLLLQTTRTSWSRGTTWIRCRGQASTHRPHPVHFSRLTHLLWSSSMTIALTGHTSLQVPRPRHPYRQALPPPAMSSAAAQEEMPWYLAFGEDSPRPPLQWTSATPLSRCFGSTPITRATASTALLPPATQTSTAASPLSTALQAASQPG